MQGVPRRLGRARILFAHPELASRGACTTEPAATGEPERAALTGAPDCPPNYRHRTKNAKACSRPRERHQPLGDATDVELQVRNARITDVDGITSLLAGMPGHDASR